MPSPHLLLAEGETCSLLPALFDWRLMVDQLWHLLAAFGLALPIGYHREKDARSAGLRTFPLVAVGACGFLMVGQQVVSGDDATARLLYGLMTGIGFIGGGAILKDKGHVSGTATAAAIWNTGAIGMAVAFNQFTIAILLVVLNFGIFWAITPLKGRVRQSGEDTDQGCLILAHFADVLSGQGGPDDADVFV